MASDAAAAAPDDGGSEKPVRSESSRAQEKPAFFSLYKPGQGYWTRMGTTAAALLIAGLCANFLYHQLPVRLGSFGMDIDRARTMSLIVIAIFLAGYGLIAFWLMNKPANADFLIATDSEMKKVNWTSRKELWGSTKVVIVFMFLIAAMLFGFDIIFGYLFYFLRVLEAKPF